MAKVADFVVKYLYEKGITDIFMLSGGGAIHLDQAVVDHPNVNEICIKNEATGPMMAEAYARVKNNFGVVFVTTGPGGANAVSGVVECFVDSSPVLIISGQVPLCQTTKNAKIPNLRTFGIQELNITEIIKSITKYSTVITNPKTIKYELDKAIDIMLSGRPGPVWLDIPLDIQAAVIDEGELDHYILMNCSKYNINIEKLNKLCIAIEKSKHPLIIIGQGIKNAGAVQELKQLADLLQAPIIISRLGLDALPISYPNNMGIGGIKGTKYNRLIMKEADLIISVGCSLSVAFAGHDLSFFNESADIFMVDIEEAEASKINTGAVDLFICDAKIFLDKLTTHIIVNKIAKPPTWLNKCIEYKINMNARKLAQKKNPIDIYYLVKKIDDLSKTNDIFVDDAGSIYYVAGQTLSFENGTKEITSGAFASMGLAIPLSIGAAIGDPKARILAMTGDGSLETNVQELKTLSYYNLNVKLFVINNGGYLSMRDHGRNSIGESHAILNLRKIAEAYDMPYHLINDYTQFDTLLPQIVNQPGPAFIEVMCDSNQKLILPLI